MNYNFIIITLCFIVLDCVTGCINGLLSKTFTSAKLRIGAQHKMAFITYIALSVLCQYASSYMNLGLDVPLIEGVCTFIVITEITSLKENIQKMREVK